MPWALIIEAIIALLPYFLAWLDKLLKKSAKSLAASGNKYADTRMLLEAALAELWWFQWAKKAVVRHLIQKAPAAVANGRGLTGADANELKALCDSAA